MSARGQDFLASRELLGAKDRLVITESTLYYQVYNYKFEVQTRQNTTIINIQHSAELRHDGSQSLFMDLRRTRLGM